MVDALPYLVDYPYGCTEQTLNRFLPTVITQKILLDMKLDLKDDPEEADEPQRPGNRRRRRAGQRLEALRPQPGLRRGRGPQDGQGRRRAAHRDAVLRRRLGLVLRLGRASSAHTTAVVVHGLQIAQQNDVALVPGVLERGVEWLKHYQDEQVNALANVDANGNPIDKTKPCKLAADNLDAFVYMVLVDAGVKNADMLDFLYRDRTNLAVYGMAMYGLALEKQDEADKLAMILRNIGQYVVQDDENQTAWLKLPEGIWWYWYGSEYEADAYYLKLLAATDPQGRARPAAGEVSAEQPQARHLLEHDPRHGPRASRRWPTSSRPAARTSPT